MFEVRCSFCGKDSNTVKRMIAGIRSEVHICNECVDLALERITETEPKPDRLLGFEVQRLERATLQDVIRISDIQALAGNALMPVEFLIKLRNMVSRADQELAERERKEVDEQITQLEKQVSTAERLLRERIDDLRVLQEKRALIPEAAVTK